MASIRHIEAKKEQRLAEMERKLDLIIEALKIQPAAAPVEDAKPGPAPATEAKPAKAK